MTHLQRTTTLAVVVLALSFGGMRAAEAVAISRNEISARAQRRIDFPVPYSQTKYYAGYRTDCSGYVSMCWDTGTSWSTRSFHNVTTRIPAASLKRGDALLKAGYHIRLFYDWLDESHTQYVAYESAWGQIAGVRIHSLADDLADGYIPVRYDRVSESPRSRNLLRNGTLDTWARRWSGDAEQPAWWDITGPSWDFMAEHRRDVYRGAYHSAGLTNPSEDPAAFAGLSQAASIVPGALYRATAWAKTASDPTAVELRLTFLGPDGTQLAEHALSGDRAQLDASGFRAMSIITTAPVEATRAQVAVRLAGGASLDASENPQPGTSVLVDDISLSRPQVVVSIKPSRTTAYTGTRVTFGGPVSPTRAAGVPATLWVKRPGGVWTKVSSPTVTASGTTAAYKASYTFTRSMPRGTYWFRTSIPGIPGYLGAYATPVSVRLK